MKKIITKPYVYYTLPLAILGFILLIVGSRTLYNKGSAGVVTSIAKEVVENSDIYTLMPIDESQLDQRVRTVLNFTGGSGLGYEIIAPVNQNIMNLYGSIDQFLGTGVKKSYRRVGIPTGMFTVDNKNITESITLMVEDNEFNKPSISLLFITIDGSDRLVSYMQSSYKIVNFRNLITLYMESLNDYHNGNLAAAQKFYDTYVYGSANNSIANMYGGLGLVGLNFQVNPESVFISDIQEINSGLQIMGDIVNQLGQSFTYQIDLLAEEGIFKIEKMKIDTNKIKLYNRLLPNE